MATIQQLHALVDINETQQGVDDRITGAEVRAVDNAIVDELAYRGSTPQAATGDLAFVAITETRAAQIPLVGFFALITSGAPADNIDTFPSSAAGWLWVRVADRTAKYFETIPAATVATEVLFIEPNKSVSKKSVNVAGGVPLLDSGGKILASQLPPLNVANGIPTLDAGGKIQTTQLPPLAITDTFVNSSQVAMLNNPAQVGDVSVRTDLNKSFILQTAPATVLANWVEMLTPIAPVQSVNSKAGVVSLTTDDVPQGAANFYFSNTLARNALSSGEGIVYDPTTGKIVLGESNSPYTTPPSNPLTLLSGDRWVQLNGHGLFFTDGASPTKYVYFGGGGYAMLGMNTSSTDAYPTGKMMISCDSTRKYQAGSTLHGWVNFLKNQFLINGNVSLFCGENENHHTFIDTEFWNGAGYPGGIINVAPSSGANHYGTLMVETGFVGAFAGGWTGVMSNITTRLKLSATGAFTGDKFWHIFIGGEPQSRSTTLLAEHIGLVINDLRLPFGTATSTIAINQIGPTDKNIFMGIMILGTAATPASGASPGATGTICWDENFFYVKTAAGGWKKVALTAVP